MGYQQQQQQQQHPTPCSSLDGMAAGMYGRSEYSSPRSSFEVAQVWTSASFSHIISLESVSASPHSSEVLKWTAAVLLHATAISALVLQSVPDGTSSTSQQMSLPVITKAAQYCAAQPCCQHCAHVCDQLLPGEGAWAHFDIRPASCYLYLRPPRRRADFKIVQNVTH